MYPELFKIGPLTVHSYGLMLGIAFLICSSLFTKELKRHNIAENHGITITFLAIIGGLIGSKLFYIIEEWNFGTGGSIWSYFNKEVLLSPSGLTFYGGLILAFVFIWIYVRIKNLRLLEIVDSMAPATMLGYGVARIGCHLSGDGCYGLPVNGTFWQFLGMSYSKGIVPTHEGVLVHPTPLYELVAAVIIFFILMALRKKMKYFGQLFFIYIIFAGLERLLVEFIRLNPHVMGILTQAQIISIIMIIAGAFFLYMFRNKRDEDLIKINSNLNKSK